MSAPVSWDWTEGRRWQRASLVVGLVGLAGCGIGALVDREQFFHSWLLAVVTWVGFPLGSLALLMLHHLTGGHWGLVIRRLLEAATRTLPLLALFFVPVAFGLGDIYDWTTPQVQTEIGQRVHYLNAPFFLIRAGIYFAIWCGLALLFQRWSVEQDRAVDLAPTRRAQLTSGPGLVLYGLTVTFASIDWVMSLDPKWASTIFGPVVVTGQMLPALALAIAAATCLARRPPLAEMATPAVWNDLGNLLLAFVMLWTYMALSQFLLIWSGNLPEEITWYINREDGGWQWIGVSLAAFYFALPFLLLLSRNNKRRPERLRVVAGAVVCMTFVHQFWLIVPSFSPGQLYLSWIDVAALAGMGGLWLAYFLRQVQAQPLMPQNDPQVAEALGHAA